MATGVLESSLEPETLDEKLDVRGVGERTEGHWKVLQVACMRHFPRVQV